MQQQQTQESLSHTIRNTLEKGLQEIKNFRLLDELTVADFAKRLFEVGAVIAQEPHVQALSQLAKVSSDLCKVVKLLADVAELREVVTNPKANDLVQLERGARKEATDNLYNVLAAGIKLTKELVSGPCINDPYNNNHQDIATTREAIRNTINYAKQPMDPNRTLALTDSISDMSNLKAPSRASRLFTGFLAIATAAAMAVIFPPASVLSFMAVVKSIEYMTKDKTPVQEQAQQLQASLKDYIKPPTASTEGKTAKEEAKVQREPEPAAEEPSTRPRLR